MKIILNVLMVTSLISIGINIYNINIMSIVLSGFVFVLLICVKNLLNKVTFYETQFEMIYDNIQIAINKMREIDKSGAFEADDVVGKIFRKLCTIVESMSSIFKMGDN